MSQQPPVECLLKIAVSESISFAAWQNSVPLITSLVVENLSSNIFDNLTLELSSSPPFLRPKTWIIDRINPKSTLSVQDRLIQLDPDYLMGLNEAERGLVRFKLIHNDKDLATQEQEIRILARDEWGGLTSHGELLAAFVMPNDAAVARILKVASDVLEKHGQSGALDGYQSGDPKRAWMLAAAIWSAIASSKLTYANPPASFERTGQKTRTPETILKTGLATCLDTTLLFSAAIEAVGLNPICVFVKGHCFAGFWLVPKTLNQFVEPDCGEIRKAIAASELITFETTLITHRPTPRLEDAIKQASFSIRESQESDFVAAIDFSRARAAQIRPLASHRPATEADPETESGGDATLPLPPATSLPHLPSDQTVIETSPTTPAGRIDRWQRKLLDLSLRNRLLNFRDTKQTIPLICADIAALEDRLADENEFRFISLHKHDLVGNRDRKLHQQISNTDLNEELAKHAFERNELVSVLEEPELSRRLVEIFRSVRNDLAEGGSNTLFLGVGFLKWKERTDVAKQYRAPLLLLPVRLNRKSASSPFRLGLQGDDPRFNATLIQLMKKDFACDLTRFESNLPMDGSGLDVRLILDHVRSVIRDIPGFEVVEETVLGRFSFAKYLMWKDLVDRTAELEKNRVVRHLIQSPDRPFDGGSNSLIREEQIDRKFSPEELFHPLSADSSQLSAVMSAAAGKDFVLVGPPGTGKSQTITNMICQLLATKKSVLFVAEKTAALDVVHRRLKEHGLAHCCIELHSNKAERKKFLSSLEQSWQISSQSRKDQWIQVSQRLKIRRDELSQYVHSIHRVYPNGWTPYKAMGVLVRERNNSNKASCRLEWPQPVAHDLTGYRNLEAIVSELSLVYSEIVGKPSLASIKKLDWSASWEKDLLDTAEKLKTACSHLKASFCQFATRIGISDRQDLSLEQLDGLNEFAKALLAASKSDTRIMFHKQFSKFPEAAAELHSLLGNIESAKSELGGDYSVDVLSEMPLEQMDVQWREANSKSWPFSSLAKRRVTKFLQSYCQTEKADPRRDIGLLRKIRDSRQGVAQSPLAGQTKLWNGVDSNPVLIREQIQFASELRSAIRKIGDPLQATPSICKAVQPFLNGVQEEAEVYRAARAFRQSRAEFIKLVKEFGVAAGKLPVTPEMSEVIRSTEDVVTKLLRNRSLLKSWTSWNRIQQKANSVGLQPLVRSLESVNCRPEDLQLVFESAYADWWLPKIVDADPVLREFQKFKHEHAIEEFRKLDETARKLSAEQAHAAVAHQLPSRDEVARQSELGMLRHQLELKRPSKSIREIVSGLPTVFGALAPCLLMSPLSIAQYLPAGQALFDVVIFDEASQITTWDAIGAIARARQTIIVGDPKQLPPTNFFGTSEDDEQNEELEDHEKDLESILDETRASGIPTLQLNWHYRSRHESLIAFSNWNYYENKLVTFPSAESADRGIRFVLVENSVYDRGKSRTNRTEAEAIVADMVQQMKAQLLRPEAERLTLGVITFNIQQQSLIQDLLDQAQRDNPDIEWFFSDDRIEPTIVKNLENVQGDERDIIYFSITFGRDITGKEISLNFGALNREGGERRLNVAITRARYSMRVYSSFRSDELRANRSKAMGVNNLQAFLDYAEKGVESFVRQSDGGRGGFDSPFEEAVAGMLQGQGWQVVSQVGVSGFRVDLGIVHPDRPGAFLAGVECDGATYHRSASARDRDKTRQLVLESLGWRIIRIWSTDWWYDSKQALEQVVARLIVALDSDRTPKKISEPSVKAEPHILETETSSKVVDESNTDCVNVAETGGSVGSSAFAHDEAPVKFVSIPKTESPSVDTLPVSQVDSNLSLQQRSSQTLPLPLTLTLDFESADATISKTYFTYIRNSLPDLSENQAQFFDPVYDKQLSELVDQIIQHEGPVRLDELAKAVARAHGFLRTGSNLTSRIHSFSERYTKTLESEGTFVWPKLEVPSILPFRYPFNQENQRAVDEIPLEELAGFIHDHAGLLNETDPALMISRELGIARLSAQARSRIDSAITRFQKTRQMDG